MTLRTFFATALLTLGTAAMPVHANNLLDGLKQQYEQSGGGSGLANSLGLSMPSMGSSTLGNAAGVIQYCVKNNYLNANSANAVKDKLLGMVTGQQPQQSGYDSGAKGLLMGEDGKSLNLQGLSAKVKEKACDYVLKNATSLL